MDFFIGIWTELLYLICPHEAAFLTLIIRDRPRFFDQVGHQTTNASIGNKHFFTK